MLVNCRLRLIDKITDSFQSTGGQSEMLKQGALSAEFLLGYHCQREALRPGPKAQPANTEDESTIEEEGEDQ